jgi:hypothetical protein
MRISRQFRAGLIGLIAIVGASVSSAARADSGTILISVFKAGWFLGGLVFGASQTRFVGTVSNIFRPSDVAGVYGAANAGAALVVGGGVIALTNDKGAILHLSGRQVGLIADLDLSGMAISLP